MVKKGKQILFNVACAQNLMIQKDIETHSMTL